MPGPRLITVCDGCGQHYDNRRPGGVCQGFLEMGNACGDTVRLSDAALVTLLSEVLVGVHGRRSRTDIMTDIAGSRAEVTPEIRNFINSCCDLLGYLTNQRGY